MAIQDAIAELVSIQTAAFPEFRAHVYVPESINPKCFVNWPSEFGFGLGAVGLSVEDYTIRTDLIIGRHTGGGLASADEALRPYLQWYWERVWLAHMTLNGTIEGFQSGPRPVTGTYGAIARYGDTEYLAIPFTQRIKIKRVVAMGV